MHDVKIDINNFFLLEMFSYN